jgi:site-specific recombinase XerD
VVKYRSFLERLSLSAATINLHPSAIRRLADESAESGWLRRTCARLCHGCGGELEQIQFLLGHASVETTERYIGSKQKLQDAVNDRLGISVAFDTA